MATTTINEALVLDAVREFKTDDGKRFRARGVVDVIDWRGRKLSVLIDPVLPRHFDDTNNDRRPAHHQRWWDRPYIVTESVKRLDERMAERTDDYAEQARAQWNDVGRQNWLEAYPSGVRWMVRCLDGGAWDRSSQWGCYGSLAEALARVSEGPAWRRALVASKSTAGEKDGQ